MRISYVVRAAIGDTFVLCVLAFLAIAFLANPLLDVVNYLLDLIGKL